MVLMPFTKSSCLIFLFCSSPGYRLGRGNYSNYFIVYQRCNIGSNHDIYPSMGENLIMHPGSAILGNCKVGDNCRLLRGSLMLDMDLEANSIYIGNPTTTLLRSQMPTQYLVVIFLEDNYLMNRKDFEKHLISKDTTLLKAMEHLETAASHVMCM